MPPGRPSPPNDAARPGAAPLRSLHVRVTSPHGTTGDARVQLYDAHPTGTAPCQLVANPLSVRRRYVADLIALLREGAAAVGIPLTVDGSYFTR